MRAGIHKVRWTLLRVLPRLTDARIGTCELADLANKCFTTCWHLFRASGWQSALRTEFRQSDITWVLATFWAGIWFVQTDENWVSEYARWDFRWNQTVTVLSLAGNGNRVEQ